MLFILYKYTITTYNSRENYNLELIYLLRKTQSDFVIRGEISGKTPPYLPIA